MSLPCAHDPGGKTLTAARGLVDYHTHTYRCKHGTGDIDEYVEAGIAAGLAEIGCSEHIPLYWLDAAERKRRWDFAMDEADLDDYVYAVLDARQRYAEQITVRLGLEADIIPGHEATLQAILDRYPWDYVIGSCHWLGDWAIDYSGDIDRFATVDLADTYRRYFDIVCQAAASGRFDFLGHLDLLKKFGHRPPGDPGPLYAHVAQRIAAAGVAVEISTAGLHKPVHEIYPHPDLLAALHAAGVPITFSSDAHNPSEVARDFDQALALARRAGYQHFASYEQRQRSLHLLPEE